MDLLDYKSSSWYLFDENGRLILHVACEYSFVGYDFLMFLNEEEISNYQKIGSDFLDQLSSEINFSCPIAKQSKSIYKGRNLDDIYIEKAGDVISQLW